MHGTLRVVSVLALLIAIAPATSPAGPAPADTGAAAGPVLAPPPAPQATCVFTNPSFAGKCVENAEVAEGSSPTQACQAILACLNNVGCLKTYCQATNIRTGWKLASAK